jgi:hypothetical protein
MSEQGCSGARKNSNDIRNRPAEHRRGPLLWAWVDGVEFRPGTKWTCKCGEWEDVWEAGLSGKGHGVKALGTLDLIDKHLKKCKAGGPGTVTECKDGKKVKRNGPTGAKKGRPKGRKDKKKREGRAKAKVEARGVETESD